MAKKFIRRSVILCLVAVFAFVLTACGSGSEDGEGLSGRIKIDGSSTVYPISEAIAEEFMLKNRGVQITVAPSGTGNGFKKLISGEIDIADASRIIKKEELEQLHANGGDTIEMPIAYDGITVVINKENTFADEMTVEELKKIWEPNSKISKWSDVRAEWPNEPIKLFAPATSSGTFEYFTEAIVGEAKASRTDYTPASDHNTLVRGIAGEKFSLGYFGYSYYEENQDQLATVKVKEDEDAEAIEPTRASIGDGSYKPLSREVYIYPLKSSWEQPHVQAFLEYYNGPEGQMLAESVGYIRLEEDKYKENLKQIGLE